MRNRTSLLWTYKRPKAASQDAYFDSAIRTFNERSELSLNHVAKIDMEALKRAIVCQLFDDRGTPNGDKLIKRALSEICTRELFAVFLNNCPQIERWEMAGFRFLQPETRHSVNGQ